MLKAQKTQKIARYVSLSTQSYLNYYYSRFLGLLFLSSVDFLLSIPIKLKL